MMMMIIQSTNCWIVWGGRIMLKSKNHRIWRASLKPYLWFCGSLFLLEKCLIVFYSHYNVWNRVDFFVFHDHTHSYNFVKKNPQVDTFHKFQHWFVVDQPYFLLWNLLKIFLENFRKTVYGFEEVCFAEVVILKQKSFKDIFGKLP